MRAGSGAYWWLVGGYVGVLFAVQPFLGFGVDAFKERWGDDGLRLTVGAVGIVAGLALLVLVMRLASALTPRDAIVLLLGGAAYGLGVLRLEIAQERLHYVEYGLLAALIFVGLRGRRSGELSAMAAAVVAGASLGLLDETLQGWLWPRRYFDWLDVGLNFKAALVGVVLAVPLHRAWLRRTSMRASAEAER